MTDRLFTIETPDGRRTLKISSFKALDGFFIKARIREFFASADQAARRAFIVAVLGHTAWIQEGKEPIILDSEATIDSVCGTWKNVESLLLATLASNGIDYVQAVNEDIQRHWSLAGEQMSEALMRGLLTTLGPIFERMAERANNG